MRPTPQKEKSALQWRGTLVPERQGRCPEESTMKARQAIHGNTRPEAHRLSARCASWPNAIPRHGAEAALRRADIVPARRWPSRLLELPFKGDGADRRTVG